MSTRITDSMLSNKYLSTINKLKSSVAKLNQDVSTQTKIHAPSDSPTGIAKLLGLNKKMSECDTFTNNIDEGNSFITATINSMESIQSYITDTLSTLIEINDETKNDALDSYADKIDAAIDSILSAANSDFGGKYLFGGTDFSSEPFSLASDGNSIQQLVGDLSGKSKVYITSNTKVSTNISGAELFSTIVNQGGNIDSTVAIGASVPSQTTIYDGAGNSYTMDITYTKTATSTYDMTYTITDSDGNNVYTKPTSSAIVFDATSGDILTVDGSKKTTMNVSVPGNNINLTLDIGGVGESTSASALTFSANQDRDIFSTLIAIRNNLRNGIKPNDSDIKIVDDFNNHILDKLAEAGNVGTQLDNTKDMLSNRKLMLQNLASNENDVDVTQAIVDLENQDYLLQLSYKVASMTLTQTLLDYL